MPRRVHLLPPDLRGLLRRHHTPPVTATRATAAVCTARVDAPEPMLPPPETSICVSSPTLSVARPVAVMVTSDRRHAVMIPVGPAHSTPAAMSPVQPWTTNGPQLGDDAEDRAGHRP